MTWILLTAVLLVIIAFLSRFCYRIAFYNLNETEQDAYAIPPGKQYESVADTMREMIREAEALSYELVSVKSRDGLHLMARYYHFHDHAPVQILFHGYRGSAIREFSGNYRLARKLGFNCLVVDERAHGKSSGHTITFGIKERYDCLAWAEYIRDRFGPDTKILLSGISMGAATVLMASELDLPDNVAVITADCPYSSPGAIIKKVTRDVGLPVWLSYPLVVIGALVFGRFCIWQSSPVKAVAGAKIPILLIHGEDDRFVPCEMSRMIYKACAGPSRLLTVPGAGHGLSYLVDPDTYEQTVRDFLKKYGVPTEDPGP